MQNMLSSVFGRSPNK